MAAQTLVHGPVELQARLAAVQQAVAVALRLSVGEGVVEHANLGDVAMEALSVGLEAVGTAHGEGSKVSLLGGGKRFGCAAVYTESKVAAIPCHRQQGVCLGG